MAERIAAHPALATNFEHASSYDIHSTTEPEGSAFLRRVRDSLVGQLTARAASVFLATGLALTTTEAAHAEPREHVYTVTNTGNDGVWLHADPGLGDQNDLIKVMAEGTVFTADCYVNDTPVGPRNNPAWLHGKDETGTVGFFSDVYSSSRWDASNTLHDQGLPFCGENVSAPPPAAPENIQPAESLPPFVNLDRQKAANWALAHAKDTPPNAGSCTWFVSNALWAGGIRETPQWNNDFRGVQRDPDNPIQYGSDHAWRTADFLEYMRTQPFTEVQSLGRIDGKASLPQARLGDVIIYDWENNGSVDHAVMITGFSDENPQYPLVSGWSEDEGRALWYNQRGWTWSEKRRDWIVMARNKEHRDARAWFIHFRTEDEVVG